ncbi:MAG: sugar phosphate isomerase/epimerase family protein [Clostridia bacterium]|nr:sugar phosphate isomerase/epimerase family protein [Clostridia bacterium]
MKFGNAAWGFRETPLETQLKITNEMGLKVLELGIANAPNDIPISADDGELEAVKALYEKYGVELCCAATGNDFTNGDKNDVPKVKRVIDICAKLGVKYLRIFAGFSPIADVVGDRWDNMIKCLEETAQYAEEKGVYPVIETHGGVNGFDDGVEHIMSTTTDLDSLKKIIAAIPDNARICYDPANLYAVGIKNPEEFYSEIKDKTAYAHFKDFVPVASGHILPSFCGASHMDWNAILNAMNGFNGPVLFEYENVEDIQQGLEKSYKFISERI